MAAMQASGLQACEQTSPANRYDTVKTTVQFCNELSVSTHPSSRLSQLSMPSNTAELLVLTGLGSSLSEQRKAAAAMRGSVRPGRLIKHAPVEVHSLPPVPGLVPLRVSITGTACRYLTGTTCQYLTGTGCHCLSVSQGICQAAGLPGCRLHTSGGEFNSTGPLFCNLTKVVFGAETAAMTSLGSRDEFRLAAGAEPLGQRQRACVIRWLACFRMFLHLSFMSTCTASTLCA